MGKEPVFVGNSIFNPQSPTLTRSLSHLNVCCIPSLLLPLILLFSATSLHSDCSFSVHSL